MLFRQDLVFSVKLHFGLTLYPLSLFLYPFSLIPYLISLIPTPCSLSPSTVPFTKFRWGLLSFLSFLSFLLLWLSPAKVKSTPSPRLKTGVWQKLVSISDNAVIAAAANDWVWLDWDDESYCVLQRRQARTLTIQWLLQLIRMKSSDNWVEG